MERNIFSLKSDQSSRLDPTVTGLLWGKGFAIGHGINALTGTVSAPAVQPPALVPATTKSSGTRYSLIQDQSDLEQEIEVSASGKYNMEGVDLSASSSFLNKVKVSDLCITLVAEYESHYQDYDKATSYQLTDEAKQLIGDHDKFRDIYGDYFVAGKLRGSRFYATYVCQSHSTENMNEFKASFKGEVPDLFSAEGSTRFMKAARTNSISVNVYVSMEGYSGTPPVGPWDPEKILEAQKWFVEHEEGVALEALLYHYSMLNHNFSPIVNVDPAVFVELHDLYIDRWMVLTLFDSLPSAYRSKYQKDIQNFNTTVQVKAETLVQDAKERGELADRASKLVMGLSDILAREDFYLKVKSRVSKEPPVHQLIKEEIGRNRWLYGFNYSPKNAVVLQSASYRHQEDAYPTWWREYTFQFNEPTKLIVGWEVVANWDDGTDGTWRKEVDQILLTSTSSITIDSQYGRGYDWGLNIFFVNREDYQFGDLEGAEGSLSPEA